MNNDAGIRQLPNGYWEYRLVITIDGKRKSIKRRQDDAGNKFKTKKQAAKARQQALLKSNLTPTQKHTVRKTISEIYLEYCENGRKGKAYSTIKKQDSLWNNHIGKKFGKRFIDEITVAEINDYLAELYYVEGRAYSYVEAFIKLFYLIFGQAYTRNYIDVDIYNKFCKNKDTKIKMPPRKTEDTAEIITFSQEEIAILNEYFASTTLNTAYILGKYCGLRINECFGLKWSNIDLNAGTITIDRQMQYQNGVIKLVSPKTRNAVRTIYMATPLKEYLFQLKKTIDIAEAELAEMRNQQQMPIKDSDGSTISSLELVNTLPNGKMRTINSMKRHTRNLLEKYGIRFKYHYLRHTYGTILAELNTPTHLLCNQMGHASSKVTERYYLAISQRGINILLDNLNKI